MPSSDDKSATGRGLESIHAIMARIPELAERELRFQAGDIILRHKELTDRVFIVLEGTGVLEKPAEDAAGRHRIGEFGPGDLLGLTSFWNREPTIADTRATEPVACLALDRPLFDRLHTEDPAFSRTVTDLFLSNLSERYRRGMLLNERVAELSRSLENESQQLREAYAELERTHERLIARERLATLGQLIAGLAHELNNPASALDRNLDHLRELIDRALPAAAASHEFMTVGLQSGYLSSTDKRARLQDLESQYPDIPRSLLRRLAHLPDSSFQKLKQHLVPGSASTEETLPLLDAFELGLCLRGFRVSTGRIAQLVTSPKNYGRSQAVGWELIDPRDGIRDTLNLLNYRLKNYEFRATLEEVSRVRALAGQLNQVWTNLLVNAIQATPAGGEIEIRSNAHPDGVAVEVTDRGSGIAPGLEEKIFESEFSTKRDQSESGMGLGLAITRDIVHRHNGRITAENRPGGGALFRVILPAA